MATVKEAFKMKYQGNKNAPIVEVSFAQGEDIKVIQDWKNDTCLVRKDDKVFNVPNNYLSK